MGNSKSTTMLVMSLRMRPTTTCGNGAFVADAGGFTRPKPQRHATAWTRLSPTCGRVIPSVAAASSPLQDGRVATARLDFENALVVGVSVSRGEVEVQAATSRRRNPATPITARTAMVPTATSTAGTDRPLTSGSCPAYW